jgi:DNA-binding NarL/FixJ family response regulator
MNPSTVSAAVVADADRPAGETIGIVADRRLSVAALLALLLRDPRYRVIQEARGVAELTALFSRFRPLLLIIESTWSGWPPSTDPAEWGGRTLLLLDPADEPDAFVAAAKAGVQGYLSRTASREAFASAIESVRSGGYHLDALLGERILSALRGTGRTPVPARPSLSQHEREILVRIASGKSSKEIAREYAITPKTVANQITNMYQKLNLRHRGDLVLYAAHEGLTSLTSPDGVTTVPLGTAASIP